MTKQTRIRKFILAVCLLIVSISVVVAPAAASSYHYFNLKASPDRIDSLQHAFWESWKTPDGRNLTYLPWMKPDLQFLYQKSYPLSKTPTIILGYECAQPATGDYWGECTSFVEAFTTVQKCNLSTVATHDWYKGDKAMTANLVPGNVIATWPDGYQATYHILYQSKKGCHAVIFAGYDSGKTGFWVWDQHYYSIKDSNGNDIKDSQGNTEHYPIICKHFIPAGGAITNSDGKINNGNANNYYAVQLKVLDIPPITITPIVLK